MTSDDYRRFHLVVYADVTGNWGLTDFQAWSYVWSIAARGWWALNGDYEKMEH